MTIKSLLSGALIAGMTFFSPGNAATSLDSVLSEAKMERYRQLEISLKDAAVLHDTDKPNALILSPLYDDVGMFYTYNASNFYKLLSYYYDTKVVVVETKYEAFDAIRNTPNVKLLVTAGHGTASAIAFGWKDPAAMPGLDAAGKKLDASHEKYYLTLHEEGLEEALNNLEPDADILLISCSTAEGGEGADNLANYIKKKAGKRRVHASMIPLSWGGLRVNSFNPLSVQIRECYASRLFRSCVEGTYVK